MCATLCGTHVDTPGPDDRLSYLELGCGLGFGALLLAAANPAWCVTAIDINPAHIAMARRMAAESGITNATFIEADFATLAEDSVVMAGIPQAHVVSLHGVWSWVAPAVQAGIIRLLKARVMAGGLVHVSYNSLPAWQSVIGLQRLVREAGRRLPARSDKRAAHGLALAERLITAGAPNLRSSPLVGAMMQALATKQVKYLAHELMNGNWAPCFHADVAEAMAEARLDWVGSATIVENFPELILDEAQRDIQAGHEEPLMRELVKDLCLERGLRSDIFVRGNSHITPAARDATLGQLTVGLLVSPDKFCYEVSMPVGQVSMHHAFYGRAVEALASGPKRISELLDLPGQSSRSRNSAELIGMLVGSGQACLVVRPGVCVGEEAQRFNATGARQFVDVAQLGKSLGVASNTLGGGLSCSELEMFLLQRMQAVGGWIDPAPWVTELAPDLPPDDANRLRQVMKDLLEERLPAWRLAGLA